jgi:hypothetical protein
MRASISWEGDFAPAGGLFFMGTRGSFAHSYRAARRDGKRQGPEDAGPEG